MASPGGTLALVGAGEFLPSMRDVDAALLERSGGLRVAVLPTASAPDGAGVPERWAEMGVRHFGGLGAQASAVMALERPDCYRDEFVEAVRGADLVYFSGGKPGHLLRSVAHTPLWAAVIEVVERGGALAGCSAGAMILGGWIPGRFSLRRQSFWTPALGLVPGAVVLPHFDELPRWAERLGRRLIPRSADLIGIDAGTALVVGADRQRVLGRGRVVVATRRMRRVFLEGQPVDLGMTGP